MRAMKAVAAQQPPTSRDYDDVTAADNFVFSLKCIGVFAVGAWIIRAATAREPAPRPPFSRVWDDRYDIFNPPPADGKDDD